jgi:hypothetical protein
MQTTWTQPSTVSVRVGFVLRSAEVILVLFDLLPSSRTLCRERGWTVLGLIDGQVSGDSCKVTNSKSLPNGRLAA